VILLEILPGVAILAAAGPEVWYHVETAPAGAATLAVTELLAGNEIPQKLLSAPAFTDVIL
jgi:hypothetical protein